MKAAKTYIRHEYGTDYVAPDVVVIERIAPTDVNRVPEDLPGDGAALYSLIWRSFIAAHITPAQERITATRILVGASQGKPYPLELRTTAKRLYFDGWRRVLPNAADDQTLPLLKEGETLAIQQIVTEMMTSEALSRYTLAALVGVLVESGLDVPSAVQVVETLHAAQHVTDESGTLALTESGNMLAAYLAEAFGELTSPSCAAELAADLERIALGERERLDVLRAFWSRFAQALRPIPVPRAIAEHKPIVLRPVEEV